MIKTASLSVGLACAILATGCDSNNKSTSGSSSTSSSSSSSTSSGSLALENVYVAFPPPVSHTQDTTIKVRGAVTDSTGVTDVLVNGVSASTDDNWAQWIAEVPLIDGDNQLEISYVTDADETHNVTTLQVSKGLELVSASRLVLDSDNNRLLVLDRALSSIIAIDIATGIHTQMSPPESGENHLQQTLGMTLDRAGNRLIINRRNTENPIVHVDLTTGEQLLGDYEGFEDITVSIPSTLEASGGDVYTGGIEVFPGISGGDCRAPVRSSTQADNLLSAAIISILDPATGESSILTRLKDSISENDASLLSVQALADDAQSDVLYVLDSCSIALTNSARASVHRLKKVDKTSGEVSWLYPESLAEQTALIEKAKEAWNASNDIEEVRAQFALKSPTELQLDYSSSALFVLDDNNLVKFDLISGESSVVAGNSVPPDVEPQSIGTISFALDRAAQQFYTYDIALNQFLVIDTADGNRTRLGDQYYDPDTVFIAPNSIILDIFTNRFFTTDRRPSTLYMSDLNTGARTRLADNTIPTDKARISQPIALTRDNSATDLFVLSQEYVRKPDSNTSEPVARLTSVNAETGTKNELFAFNPRVGWGESPLYDVVYSTSKRTAYIAQQYENGYGVIHRLRLREDDTSEISLLTAPGLPDHDHPLRTPTAIVLDESRNRLLAVDRTVKALIAIDLTTGARTPLSAHSNDEGAINLKVPRDVSLNGAGTHALVLDSGLDAIVSIDLETGARTLVTENPDNVRQQLIAPIAMAVHPVFDYILVIEEARDAVMALDLVTNERVRLAR